MQDGLGGVSTGGSAVCPTLRGVGFLLLSRFSEHDDDDGNDEETEGDVKESVGFFCFGFRGSCSFGGRRGFGL